MEGELNEDFLGIKTIPDFLGNNKRVLIHGERGRERKRKVFGLGFGFSLRLDFGEFGVDREFSSALNLSIPHNLPLTLTLWLILLSYSRTRTRIHCCDDGEKK